MLSLPHGGGSGNWYLHTPAGCLIHISKCRVCTFFSQMCPFIVSHKILISCKILLTRICYLVSKKGEILCILLITVNIIVIWEDWTGFYSHCLKSLILTSFYLKRVWFFRNTKINIWMLGKRTNEVISVINQNNSPLLTCCEDWWEVCVECQTSKNTILHNKDHCIFLNLNCTGTVLY